MLAARRLKKRSLLEVNEHFLDKADDTDDPLSQEIIFLILEKQICPIVIKKYRGIVHEVQPTIFCLG